MVVGHFDSLPQRSSVCYLLLFVWFGVVPGCSKPEQPTQVAPQKQRQPDIKVETPKQKLRQTVETTSSITTGYASLTDAERTRVQSRYAQHCAACHGEKGDGQGIAARFLLPKPRDFQAGHFRLVTTSNGVPTISDLDAVIGRGMPGSAMPPWPNLNEADRKLLAERLIEFRREAIRNRERALAAEDEEEVDEDELNDLVRALTTPGPSIEVPQLSEPTIEAVGRGKQLYLTSGCASCHGNEGRGDGQQEMVDAEGLPTRPRDLTKGIFKGSPDVKSVYLRTQAGMPGSPMPATGKLTPEQIEDLVHFVRSLSDEETRKATVLNRERIVATSVNTVATSVDDPAWNDITSAHPRLTPLWWRDDFPPYVEVQAMHDGQSVSLRLRWADAEADSHAARSEAFKDAVAVELYRGDAEPFLGMGAAKSAVEVWMWDADRQSGTPAVEELNPNVVVDLYPLTEGIAETAEYRRPGTATAAQADVTVAARAAGNQIVPRPGASTVSSFETAGPGTVTFRPPVSQFVQADGKWHDGQWTVVMTRPLLLENDQTGISMATGERLSIAFAVWNGSRRDRDGQKLITIWQDFLLEKK